jgi:hypothetical protein
MDGAEDLVVLGLNQNNYMQQTGQREHGPGGGSVLAPTSQIHSALLWFPLTHPWKGLSTSRVSILGQVQ